MLLRRLTPLSQVPAALSLEDAKLHLHVDADYEDTLIVGYVAAAAEVWERYVKLPLMRAEYLLLTRSLGTRLDLGAGPIEQVAEVAYVPYGEIDPLVVESSRYSIGLSDPDTLQFAFPVGSYPLTRGDVEAVRIRFTAGAVSAADVPPLRRQALLLLLGHFYVNRQTTFIGQNIGEIPFSAQQLMDLERLPTL